MASSVIRTQPYGGNGGREFAISAFKTIGLRAGDEIDQIRLDADKHGGPSGGIDRGSITLGSGEYIHKIEIESGPSYVEKPKKHDVIRYVKFTTNNEHSIEGGKIHDQHNVKTLTGIRVIGIGGRSGGEVDKLNIMYVTDYKASKIVDRNAGFILSFTAPSQEFEEYTDEKIKRKASYLEITKNMITQRYSASVQAEYYVKASLEAELKLEDATLTKISRELEEEIKHGHFSRSTLDANQVGVLLVKGDVMQGADGKHWVDPTGKPNYAKIGVTEKERVFGHYDLTGELHVQMDGLGDYRDSNRNGMVYYCTQEVDAKGHCQERHGARQRLRAFQ